MASGEVWDKAGGETEQGKGTSLGGMEGTFLSGGSPWSESVFVVPVLCVKTWGRVKMKMC